MTTSIIPLEVPLESKEHRLAAAASAHIEGRSEVAFSILTSLVSEDPDYLEALYARGRVALELAKFSDALESYSRYLELYPESSQAPFYVGVCLQNLGRWQEAEKAFSTAAEADPGSRDARLGLAIARLHTKQPERALELYDSLLSEDQADEEAWFGKGAALQQMGNSGEAIAAYQNVLSLNSASREALTNLISIARIQNDNASLKHWASQLLAIDSNSESALQALGFVSFTEARFAEAAQYCQNAVEVNSSFENWLNLALCREKSGEIELAAEACRNAVSIQPDSSPAHALLGSLSHALGDDTQAISAYRRAHELSPGSSDIATNLAVLYEQNGVSAEAERLYQKIGASGDRSNSAEAWLRLGLMRRAAGDLPAAATAFKKAVDQRQDWTEARLHYAYALYGSGKLDKAVTALNEIFALAPENVDAIKGLATIALEREDLPEAYSLHMRLIAAGEKTAEVYYNAGLLAQQTGREQEAETLYRQSLEINPQFASALVNLGHTLEALGRHDESKECWRRAMEIDPKLSAGYFSDDRPRSR